MNYNVEDLIINTEDRIGKDQNYFLNSNKIRKNLNWKNHINIEDGIHRVINWIEINSKSLLKHHTKYIHKK